jgi:hypothetical protein
MKMYQPVNNGKKKGVNGFNINVGTTLPENVFAEIETLARLHGMPIAKVLRHLTLRGLDAYRRDRQLNDNAEAGLPSPTGELYLSAVSHEAGN